MESLRTGRRRIRRRLVVATMAVAALGSLAWGAEAWARLTRLEVRIADARARVEAASRNRAALVSNLVRSTEQFSCLDAARRTRLESVAARAAELSPPAQPALDSTFADAQRELTAVLEEIWPDLEASGRAGSSIVADDLRARLEQAGMLLDRTLDDFVSSREAYDETTRRFPGSMIAALATADPRAPLGADHD